MRNLFFALVLANLAVAAWTAWYSESPRATAAASPSEGGVPIRLVGEGEASSAADGDASARARPRTDSMTKMPETASGGAAGEAASDEAASGEAASGGTGETAADSPQLAASDRCISIGPFAEASDAEAASVALAEAGFAPSQRSAESEIWVGFWVHIDAIPTRDEANAILTRLRENGLPDAYLIPGEEDGDIISLGVFNNMTRAGRLDAQVREIGFEPLILERTRPGVVHWVDVSVPASDEVDLDALGVRGDDVEQRSCQAPAG